MSVFHKLLKNPIIKIAGIFLILYFGLFADKENPNSLGSRFSKSQLNHDLSDVKQKSHFIIANLSAAKSSPDLILAQDKAKYDANILSSIITKDLNLGEGEDIIKCGDIVEISYSINIQENNSQLEFVDRDFLVIGSKQNTLLESKIIGMKRKGVRIINIPRNFKSFNQKLSLLLKFNDADLNYRVEILDFKSGNNSSTRCENNY